MLWHVKCSSAQGETRQARRKELYWGLLNTQKTQPPEEIPKLKTEVRRLLQGSILFAFPGFALPCLSLTATAGDRILSWRRPWSDPGQLLWWTSYWHLSISFIPFKLGVIQAPYTVIRQRWTSAKGSAKIHLPPSIIQRPFPQSPSAVQNKSGS